MTFKEETPCMLEKLFNTIANNMSLLTICLVAALAIAAT